MNKLIESLFNNFIVDGVPIPVNFLYYEGHDEPFVTYRQMDSESVLRGDDELLGYIDYYDFNIYSKGNYLAICEQVRRVLEANDFIWQPNRSSPDMYEVDTGYYHKTLNFSVYRMEDNNG